MMGQGWTVVRVRSSILNFHVDLCTLFLIVDKRDRKPHLCIRRHQDELFPTNKAHLRFVMHQHDATQLHYDFRFELGKALRDFVIPDGPSIDPTVSRRSISYHDHQLSCLKLEGLIRPDVNQSGPMIIWDHGFYRPIDHRNNSHEEAVWAGLDKGHLEIELFGEKLKGKWKLVRFSHDWIFQKIDDEYASSENILLQNRSVVSGKTILDFYRKVIFIRIPNNDIPVSIKEIHDV